MLVEKWLVVGASLCTLVAGSALAQSPVRADAEEKRRLIEQKIRLVETMINSPAARGAAGSGDPEAPALIERSRDAAQAAKAAIVDGRLDEASRAADEALKSAANASRRLSSRGAGLSESAQRQNFRDLREQIVGYRASVEEMAGDERLGSRARALLAHIDSQTGESTALAEAGRWGDANRKLAETYRDTVRGVASLRAGQEIVLSLKFETAADELAYEQRRFRSSQIMVDRLVDEGRAGAERRRLVDEFVGAGRRLKEEADTLAKSGSHREAVALMERANSQLNRALQVMGVPIF